MAFVCNFREALNYYGWRFIEKEFPERIKFVRETLLEYSEEENYENETDMPE